MTTRVKIIMHVRLNIITKEYQQVLENEATCLNESDMKIKCSSNGKWMNAKKGLGQPKWFSSGK